MNISRVLKGLRPLLLVAGLVVMTYLYLYPGSEAMFERRTDIVMSDGTDPAGLPFIYDGIIETWRERPSRLFLGSVYLEDWDPERGNAFWVPWVERWFVVFHSYFFNIEQIPTAFVFTLMMLNATCMYLLGRCIGWPRVISAGLGLAWAFCAYTRARAKVHNAFVGTFHLPLIFLGMWLVANGKTRRSVVLAAVCFLLAATVAHYYVVASAFLMPFFVIFAFIQPGAAKDWRRVSKRLVFAVLPAVIFLAFNFVKTVPSDAKLHRSGSLPQSGETPDGSIHPFLTMFSAHPIDYFTSDIFLAGPPNDLNPVRQSLSESVLRSLDGSNPHERTNGIRWSVWLIACLALCSVVATKYRHEQRERRSVLFFFAFGLFAFFLSMPPAGGWGPSSWLYSLVSQVRVPSRAGINLHFALLMMTGFFMISLSKWGKFTLASGVFLALMILDYPPLLQQMPMASVPAPYSELQKDKGKCGPGMYFPFVSPYQQEIVLYTAASRLRGSDCQLTNTSMDIRRVSRLTQRFPPTPEFMANLWSRPTLMDELDRVVRCVPLTWIIFDGSTPVKWAQSMCSRLGWRLFPDMTCVAQDKSAQLVRMPDECE